MLHAMILKGNFQDSVTLMVLSRDLSAAPEVNRVSVMMGTPANKDVFRETGLWHDALDEATPNDLCIVTECPSPDQTISETMAAAVRERLAEMARGKRSAGYPVVRSWRRARQLLPQANLALISVAGQYAFALAAQAIEDGCHAMIFSDNVPLDEELRLKTMAAEKGLLVMGPDCGTAIINGAPLAFANRIPAGPIAVIGASGTGIQEITSQIALAGGGVSHALGLGGRDLSDAIGGISATTALQFAARDANTRVIAFVSKPPADAVRTRILAEMAELGKPVVALFLGDRPGRRDFGDVHLVRTLDEAAALAVELAAIDITAQSLPAVAGRGIRGLFTGGTLAAEAAGLLADALDLTPDGRHDAGYMLEDGGHRVIDLGDDVYTRGRPHPMIDPHLRAEMIRALAQDAAAGVLLLDIVLGFGSHADPAGEVARAVVDMRTARGEGAPIAVIATLTGTALDPQDRASQAASLEKAGIVIAGSVREAVLLASRAVTASAPPAGGKAPLLTDPAGVINIGLRGFADDLSANDTKVVHLQWAPITEGDARLRRLAAALA